MVKDIGEEVFSPPHSSKSLEDSTFSEIHNLDNSFSANFTCLAVERLSNHDLLEDYEGERQYDLNPERTYPEGINNDLMQEISVSHTTQGNHGMENIIPIMDVFKKSYLDVFTACFWFNANVLTERAVILSYAVSNENTNTILI
ncbi:hypothetical protein SK128_015595, partial [Halocaridina rubra]